MPIVPETDRELLIQLNSQVANLEIKVSESFDRLSLAIDNFSNSLKTLEHERLTKMQREIDELKGWRQEMKGAFKLFMLLWVIITGVIVYLVIKVIGK